MNIVLPTLQIFNTPAGELHSSPCYSYREMLQFCVYYEAQEGRKQRHFKGARSVKKIIDLSTLLFPPASTSSWYQTHEGLFELTQRPRLASCVASETSDLQGHRQVYCGRGWRSQDTFKDN